MVGGPGQRAGDGRRAAVAVGVADAQRHDAAVPGDPGNANGVVACGRGRAGHPGAVTGDIGGIGIVVHAIPSGHQQRGQVGMRTVQSAVEDGDGDAAIAGGHIPGSGRVDLRQMPLVAKVRIVRHRIRFDEPIGFSELDVPALF